VVVAALAVLGWVISRLAVVIVPVVVALMIAALIEPLVGRLARRMPRLVATWIVLVAVAGMIAGIVVLLGRSIAGALDDVTREFDGAVERVEEWLRTGPLGLSEQRVESMRDAVGDVVDGFRSGLFDEPGSTIRLAGEVLGGTFLALVLVFFFAKDGPQLWAWMLARVRPVRRATIDASGRAAFASVQGWIRGVAITGAVDGVLIGGAMAVLGVPAALPVAVITVAASFFPIIGATVAGALAVAIALGSQGVTTAVILAVVVLAVQQIEGDVILPIVMRRQVALHPIVILVSLAVGAAVAGLLGALVAVPFAASVSAATRAASQLARPVDGALVLADSGSPTVGSGTNTP
jgi:predicted PurR-regulated permease PerM